jgi:hypothetical protein
LYNAAKKAVMHRVGAMGFHSTAQPHTAYRVAILVDLSPNSLSFKLQEHEICSKIPRARSVIVSAEKYLFRNGDVLHRNGPKATTAIQRRSLTFAKKSRFFGL